MRNVQLAEAEDHLADLVCEAEAGESLTILRGDKPVARIIPFRADTAPDESQRQAAVQRLIALMERGIDMGGFKIANRDQVYDRD
jgi:antitoxin (DNA-binding transcriptional repressor) of toxin-antitoxin stability system